MTAITLDQLNNARLDVKFLADLTLSKQLTAINRAGESFVTVAGISEEIKRYAVAMGMNGFAPTVKSINFNGALNNAGEGLTWILGVNAPLISQASADLNQLGIKYSAKLDAKTYYLKVIPERKFWAGSWVAASVVVECASGDFSWVSDNSFRVWSIGLGGGAEQSAFKLADYMSISPTIRVYRGISQIPPDVPVLDYCFFGVFGTNSVAVSISGFALQVSEGKPISIDWADFDPYSKKENGDLALKALAAANNAAALAAAGKNIVFNKMVNGALNNSGVGLSWIFAPGAAIVLSGDAFLESVGCKYAASVSDIRYLKSPQQTSYTMPYVGVSVLVASADFAAALTGTSLRVWMMGKSGAQNSLIMSEYEQLSPTVRRYFIKARAPASVGELDHVFIGMQATVATKFTGFAVFISENDFLAYNGLNFDPFNQAPVAAALDGRITAIENAIKPTAEENELLIPSSFHLIKGRPLYLYKSGLTKFREKTQLDIAAIGKNGTLPAVIYADSRLELDGSRLSGAGFIRAKQRFEDKDNFLIYSKAVTFYSSAPTKAGSPIILCIGDSLTYQGTVAALKSKLLEAGVTPNFIGTIKDSTDVFCEGRSSWSSSTYTRKIVGVNSDGSGVTYPVGVAGGDGVVSTAAQYLALSDESGSYPQRWKYNPFLRPATGGDAQSFNDYVFDMQHYLTTCALPDPNIVIIALGTNDVSVQLTDSDAAANVVESLRIMYAKTRLALPAAKIAIVLNGRGLNSAWLKSQKMIKAVLAEFSGREAEGVFVLPVYAVQDTKFVYGFNQTAIDAQTKVAAGTLADFIHTDEIGRSQWAEMTFAFVMNQI